MQKRIDKKTVVIVIVLIFAMVISVFALNGVIQANRAAANSNIAPYTYKMVLSYFEYWKDGNRYLADIPKESGNVVRTNLGANPEQYVEWDYWFPVATLPGNYEIEDIMNYKNYDGTWEDLNYAGGISQDEVERYYMNTAVIQNEDALIGASNTTVKFQASFRPLSSDDAIPVRDNVYRCYIAIVIKYKNLDYVEPPIEPEPEPEPNPGEGDITVEIEYRENTSTGKELLPKKTILSSTGKILNQNSIKIDDYVCKGYYVIGQNTEYFYSTNASFVIGKENYSRPTNNKLKIIFIYEKIPYASIPKCSPDLSGEADTINMIMKKGIFESTQEIEIKNAVFKIDEFVVGKDKNGKVEGNHSFNLFDLYVGTVKNRYVETHDHRSKEITTTFKVEKNVFTQSLTDPNLYSATVDVTYVATCTCFDGKPDADGDRGWAVDDGSLNINIILIENKPPVANFIYYTYKKINGEIKGSIYDKAYVGEEVLIRNESYDPNGKEDIKNIEWTIDDKYKIKLETYEDGSFFLKEHNFSSADNKIEFLSSDDSGNIVLKFNEERNYKVNLYVEDQEKLNDNCEKIIMAEILDLRPVAVIEDKVQHRYPITQLFNGKENRVVMFDSSYSYVAEFYEGLTGVTIDHSKDNWEIAPMNYQNLNNIKFDKNINIIKDNNILKISNQSLNNVKLMFKQTGQYKIRLQVTDTQGNVSEWTEKFITINEDISPTATAVLPKKEYRDSSGIAEISINNISTYSSDGDEVVVENIKYRYDSNNNGIFEDDSWFILQGNRLRTSNLGKYQILITVKDNFGQETLQEYIVDSDYKRGSTILQTEIDNIAPSITEFKIITTE